MQRVTCLVLVCASATAFSSCQRREPDPPTLLPAPAAPAPKVQAPASAMPAPTAPVPKASALSAALTSLPAASRAELDAVPFPVLLLPESYAPRTVVTGAQHWATSSFRDEQVTISLQGTDVQHDVLSPEELARLPKPERLVRGQPARSTVNEGIRSLSWDEAGVSYSLEVECADPAHDERCTRPRFVVELAERLVLRPR